MKRNFLFIYSLVLLLLIAVLSLTACTSAEDMLGEYNDIYVYGLGGKKSSSGKEYIPGSYDLQGLLPFDDYEVDQFASRWIDAKEGYFNYEFWLYNAAGELLGSSLITSDGRRIDDTGAIYGSGHRVQIMSNVTVNVVMRTEENQSVVPYRLKCHAQNSNSDDYWDWANLWIVAPTTEEDEG